MKLFWAILWFVLLVGNLITVFVSLFTNNSTFEPVVLTLFSAIFLRFSVQDLEGAK